MIPCTSVLNQVIYYTYKTNWHFHSFLTKLQDIFTSIAPLTALSIVVWSSLRSSCWLLGTRRPVKKQWTKTIDCVFPRVCLTVKPFELRGIVTHLSQLLLPIIEASGRCQRVRCKLSPTRADRSLFSVLVSTFSTGFPRNRARTIESGFTLSHFLAVAAR